MNAGLEPVREADRIEALDVVRGVALLGIFMVNMPFFSMPLGDISDPSTVGPAFHDRAAWTVVKIVFELKFLSLFSLLFGMGMAVQADRASARGGRFEPVYARRLGVLLAIGLVHGLGLWYGDILTIYAAVGFVLLIAHRLEPGPLLGLGVACLAIATVLATGTAALDLLSDAPPDAPRRAHQENAGGTLEGEQPAKPGDPGSSHQPGPSSGAGRRVPSPGPRGLEAMKASGFDPSHEIWRKAEASAYQRGPASEAFFFRAVTFALVLVLGLFGYAWRILGLFLIGAALMRLGVFAPDRGRLRRLLALWGVGIGLPLEVLAFWARHEGGVAPGAAWLPATILHETGSFALCLGYLGAIAWAVGSGRVGRLARPFGNLGRMALSNYLTQTLIATFLMYWWGLGWFGELGRAALVGLVMGIYPLQALASTLWLRTFVMGPAEWLWRSLTYLEPQPLRRMRAEP